MFSLVCNLPVTTNHFWFVSLKLVLYNYKPLLFVHGTIHVFFVVGGRYLCFLVLANKFENRWSYLIKQMIVLIIKHRKKPRECEYKFWKLRYRHLIPQRTNEGTLVQCGCPMGSVISGYRYPVYCICSVCWVRHKRHNYINVGMIWCICQWIFYWSAI